MSDKIAILLFCEGVSADAARKKIASNAHAEANKQVLAQFSRRARQTAAATQLPVFSSDTLIQTSSNFGRDLRRAVEIIFEKGFEKIICIGNDCPALSKDLILHAASLLNQNQSVAGPDGRGGVYLLGVSKETFEAKAFESLAWKTPQMLSSYLQMFDNQTATLEQLPDIHTFQELQTYQAARHFVVTLVAYIKNLIGELPSGFSAPLPSLSLATHTLRGPPQLVG